MGPGGDGSQGCRLGASQGRAGNPQTCTSPAASPCQGSFLRVLVVFCDLGLLRGGRAPTIHLRRCWKGSSTGRSCDVFDSPRLPELILSAFGRHVQLTFATSRTSSKFPS